MEWGRNIFSSRIFDVATSTCRATRLRTLLELSPFSQLQWPGGKFPSTVSSRKHRKYFIFKRHFSASEMELKIQWRSTKRRRKQTTCSRLHCRLLAWKRMRNKKNQRWAKREYIGLTIFSFVLMGTPSTGQIDFISIIDISAICCWLQEVVKTSMSNFQSSIHFPIKNSALIFSSGNRFFFRFPKSINF